MTPLTPDALARLTQRLDAAATAKTRDHWTRYLKGDATFRGVTTPDLRTALHSWWRDEDHGALPTADQKAIALALFDGPHTEDRMAGVLTLSELLLDALGPRMSREAMKSITKKMEASTRARLLSLHPQRRRKTH